MKRYALFGFDYAYPDGGWNDFEGSFETIEEAIKEATSSAFYNEKFKRYHVIDLTIGEEVAHGGREYS